MNEIKPGLKNQLKHKMNKTRFFIIIVFGILMTSFILTFDFIRILSPYKTDKVENSETLNLYFWGEIPKFNPIHPDGLYIWWIQNLIWDRIISVNEQFVWTPAIADSWTFNSDRTQLKLKIKNNLYWSNGRKVNKADFEFSYFFYKDQTLKAAIYEPILKRIKTLDFENDVLTLNLDPKFKSDPFFATHTYWTHIMNTVKLYPADIKTNPYLGTGAYKLDRFSNRGQLDLILNPKSWFFEKFKDVRMPKKILVKTVFSDQKLNQLLDLRFNQKKTLILGRDIFSMGESDWSPVQLKTETVSFSFNLSKFSRDQRKKIFSLLQKNNDLEKLNLKFKNLKIYKENTLNDPVEVKDVKLISKIDILYFKPEDEKWITYLNEKTKKLGLQFNLVKVSQSVFNEKVFKREYDVFVDTTVDEDFYPHYLSYHSNGSYNFKGWNDLQLDNDLEKLILELDTEESKFLIKKIKNYIDKQYSDVPIFSYQTSVLWTRNPCKPIQTQFQGLGLIYKAIICADNY